MLAAWMLWTVIRPMPDGFGSTVEATAQPAADRVYEIKLVADQAGTEPNVIYTEVGQPLRLRVTRTIPRPAPINSGWDGLGDRRSADGRPGDGGAFPPTPRGEFSITCAPAGSTQVRGTLRIH